MNFGMILDVTIGLVLVYALFSFLTTLVVEFINTTLNRRGRMLELALSYALDGAKPERGGWGRAFRRNARPFINVSSSRTPLTDRFLQLQTIRSLMDNGRLPSAITAEAFSRGVMTLIHEDLGAAADIKDYAALARGSSSRLARLIVELFPDKAATSEALDQRLQLYYKDVGDRLEGWFKRETQTWLFAAGIAIAFTFNVNSIDLALEISTDSNLRARLVAAATAEEKYAALALEARQQSELINLARGGESETTDAANANATAELAKEKLDSINKVLAEVEGLKLPIGKCRGDLGKIKTEDAGPTVEPDAKTPTQREFAAGRAPSKSKCAEPAFSWDYIARLASFEIFGWVITAMALSLGAPFWFDLLSKLVAIKRAGGFRTSDKDDKDSKPPQSVAGGQTSNAADTTTQKPRKIDNEDEAELKLSKALSSITPSAWERENLSPDDIRDVQRLLDVPAVLRNGRLDDPDTRAAIIKYQRDHGGSGPPDGELGRKIMLELFE